MNIVEFEGRNLIYPKWAKYMAADENGCVYAYEMEPVMESIDWDVESDEHQLKQVAKLIDVDWRDSLITISKHDKGTIDSDTVKMTVVKRDTNMIFADYSVEL